MNAKDTIASLPGLSDDGLRSLQESDERKSVQEAISAELAGRTVADIDGPLDPAPPVTAEERAKLIELAEAMDALAKDEAGELDLTAELVRINQRIEHIAATLNIRLPRF